MPEKKEKRSLLNFFRRKQTTKTNLPPNPNPVRRVHRVENPPYNNPMWAAKAVANIHEQIANNKRIKQETKFFVDEITEKILDYTKQIYSLDIKYSYTWFLDTLIAELFNKYKSKITEKNLRSNIDIETFCAKIHSKIEGSGLELFEILKMPTTTETSIAQNPLGNVKIDTIFNLKIDHNTIGKIIDEIILELIETVKNLEISMKLDKEKEILETAKKLNMSQSSGFDEDEILDVRELFKKTYPEILEYIKNVIPKYFKKYLLLPEHKHLKMKQDNIVPETILKHLINKFVIMNNRYLKYLDNEENYKKTYKQNPTNLLKEVNDSLTKHMNFSCNGKNTNPRHLNIFNTLMMIYDDMIESKVDLFVGNKSYQECNDLEYSEPTNHSQNNPHGDVSELTGRGFGANPPWDFSGGYKKSVNKYARRKTMHLSKNKTKHNKRKRTVTRKH